MTIFVAVRVTPRRGAPAQGDTGEIHGDMGRYGGDLGVGALLGDTGKIYGHMGRYGPRRGAPA